MSNMRIRNMFLLVTALAVMFLLACSEPTSTPQPTLAPTPKPIPEEVVIESNHLVEQGIDLGQVGDYQSAITSLT